MAEDKRLSPLESLGLLSRGTVTVSVNGHPMVSVRADERELDLELEGVKEAGLSLSRLVKLEEGRKNLISASESVARDLSKLGWKLVVYDRGEKLLAMGHGVSRLTGRVSLNPLKARKILDALN
jgi:hypothetical protein